jgi:hypothetical protein
VVKDGLRIARNLDSLVKDLWGVIEGGGFREDDNKFFELKKRVENRTKLMQAVPVACIASELDEYPDGKKIRFAIVVHNPLDTFDRDEARSRAIARLENRKMKPEDWAKLEPKDPRKRPVVEYTLTVDREGAKQSILSALVADDKMPTRVREAAKYLLKHPKPKRVRDNGPH